MHILKLSGFTTEKRKPGIIDSTQIQQFTGDPHCIHSINEIESCAFISFVLVARNCLKQKGKILHVQDVLFLFNIYMCYFIYGTLTLLKAGRNEIVMGRAIT